MHAELAERHFDPDATRAGAANQGIRILGKARFIVVMTIPPP
jgi:hypothetical protein